MRFSSVGPTDPATRPAATRAGAPCPDQLRAALAWAGRRCDLVLTGALHAGSEVALAAGYEQLVRAGLDEVVIDVAALDRVDESGAVALAELWARLRNDGIGCRIHGLHPVFADSPLEFLLFVRNAGGARPGNA